MKTTFYTLIIFGLALPISLRAQDAPSRPLKDPSSDIEPTPLPKSSSAPAPTPQATPHKVELPVSKPSPSSTPEPSPPPTPTATPEESPAIIEPTPVNATPTPAQVTRRRRARKERPAQPQPESVAKATPLSRGDARTVAAKLKALEKEWEASFNDSGVIERVLADDFVGTSPAGKIMTKKALLREAKEDTSPPPKTIARDMDVNFHGADVAIVTGATKQIDRNRAGQIVEHDYRFTDTWVQRGGQWRCVASQSMLVPRP
jgi:ketosteroid isomerase-like protein